LGARRPILVFKGHESAHIISAAGGPAHDVGLPNVSLRCELHPLLGYVHLDCTQGNQKGEKDRGGDKEINREGGKGRRKMDLQSLLGHVHLGCSGNPQGIERGIIREEVIQKGRKGVHSPSLVTSTWTAHRGTGKARGKGLQTVLIPLAFAHIGPRKGHEPNGLATAHREFRKGKKERNLRPADVYRRVNRPFLALLKGAQTQCAHSNGLRAYPFSFFFFFLVLLFFSLFFFCVTPPMPYSSPVSPMVLRSLQMRRNSADGIVTGLVLLLGDAQVLRSDVDQLHLKVGDLV